MGQVCEQAEKNAQREHEGPIRLEASGEIGGQATGSNKQLRNRDETLLRLQLPVINLRVALATETQVNAVIESEQGEPTDDEYSKNSCQYA